MEVCATYLQTRTMSKECLGTLGVVVSAVADCRAWRTDGEATNVELIARAVSVFGCLIDNLMTVF